ncbi:MAG: UPF0175 family protein [Anaerolineae bacterium]|nr:UPF0175 family protein [Anaerolineae bacterium]
MDTLKIEVELPRDMLVALNITASEASQVAKELVVLELFREGEISGGKAAEILGLTKFQFMSLLATRDISYLDLDGRSLQDDVQTAMDAGRPAVK